MFPECLTSVSYYVKPFPFPYHLIFWHHIFRLTVTLGRNRFFVSEKNFLFDKKWSRRENRALMLTQSLYLLVQYTRTDLSVYLSFLAVPPNAFEGPPYPDWCISTIYECWTILLKRPSNIIRMRVFLHHIHQLYIFREKIEDYFRFLTRIGETRFSIFVCKS